MSSSYVLGGFEVHGNYAYQRQWANVPVSAVRVKPDFFRPPVSVPMYMLVISVFVSGVRYFFLGKAEITRLQGRVTGDELYFQKSENHWWAGY